MHLKNYHHFSIVVITQMGVIVIKQSGLLDMPFKQHDLLEDFTPIGADDLVEVSSLSNDHWITKGNAMIESKYSLTLQQQRLLLIIASKIHPKDENFKLYRFHTKDVIDILGMANTSGNYYGSYYKEIRTIVKDLQSKSLTIKSEVGETDFSWVITANYYKDHGYFEVELHPRLKPYFLQLKDKFTKYRLENVLKLNSPYSIRIYELLKQYEKIRVRRFEVDELKELLAIESGKYKLYGHFKSKILLPAQEQIEKHTDLRFDFKEIKSGRKITRLEFHIKTKTKAFEIDSADALNFKLAEFQISKKQIHNIRGKWDDAYIERNIEYVNAKLQNSYITNPAGYLMNALMDDYASTEHTPKYIREEPDIKLSNQNSNFDERYEKEVEQYEETLTAIRKLQMKLGAVIEDVEISSKSDLFAYCNYQLKHYGKKIAHIQFKDETLASYCLDWSKENVE